MFNFLINVILTFVTVSIFSHVYPTMPDWGAGMLSAMIYYQMQNYDRFSELKERLKQ